MKILSRLLLVATFATSALSAAFLTACSEDDSEFNSYSTHAENLMTRAGETVDKQYFTTTDSVVYQYNIYMHTTYTRPVQSYHVTVWVLFYHDQKGKLNVSLEEYYCQDIMCSVTGASLERNYNGFGYLLTISGKNEDYLDCIGVLENTIFGAY